MILGVGSFAHATAQILRDGGAEVCTYLTRDYAHYPPSLAGDTFDSTAYPDPGALIRERSIDFLLPMSINWSLAPWTESVLACGVPILSPTGEAMRIERERDFARRLCEKFAVPFPRAHFAANRQEAEKTVRANPLPYVIKNPLCSVTSPIHTVICESPGDTLTWLERIDDAEGIFLQEYMGRREAGHVAFVSDGEIFSLVTNQEYKRAFTGNMGIVAGAPLGGLVEVDPGDKYGLAKALLRPLLPWFRDTGFHGPIQVTAALRDGTWHVLEYNIRLGVTCAPMVLRLLRDPVAVLWDVVRNRKPDIHFRPGARFACSLTLAGYGYPFTQITGPPVPVRITGAFDCDVWWNEVTRNVRGKLVMTGHRIADVIACSDTLEGAIGKAYENIAKLQCLSSYYRTDIGRSLWPPGQE